MVATFTEIPTRRANGIPHLQLVANQHAGVSRAVRKPSSSRYVRRRIVAAIVGAGVLGGVVQAGGALADSSPSNRPVRPTTVQTHVVQPGETLWSISQELAPDRDPRAVVDAIVAARGSVAVEPGEVITWQG